MDLPTWDEMFQAIKTLGWTKAVFTVFFFGAHSVIYGLYRGRLKDRQKEIDRLAAENHEYRDKFMKIIDKERRGKK